MQVDKDFAIIILLKLLPSGTQGMREAQTYATGFLSFLMQ
jgi:hypothetical protein